MRHTIPISCISEIVFVGIIIKTLLQYDIALKHVYTLHFNVIHIDIVYFSILSYTDILYVSLVFQHMQLFSSFLFTSDFNVSPIDNRFLKSSSLFTSKHQVFVFQLFIYSSLSRLLSSLLRVVSSFLISFVQSFSVSNFLFYLS